ncbi:M50 family metallopeptidase [Effusibacillus dendaii]|nr:M50 family metallopeptidase [Effusibacillus dendaii]
MRWKVHPLFVGLMALSYWTPYFQQMVLLFGCVLLHELAHVAAAVSYGYRVKTIEILPFGGVARLEHGSLGWHPKHETVIAIVGPLTNFLILFLVILLQQLNWIHDATASYLAEINLMLAFFNLLPALPLDGGRILRAAYSCTLGFQKATVVAITMAFVLSACLMSLGLLALWAGFVQVGMVTLGAFLLTAAWQLRKQIQYDTIRFLDAKRRQRFARPLPVRSLAATANTPLLKVLSQFAPDAYHVVYVKDQATQNMRILMEEDLLEAARRPGAIRMPLGQIFEGD